MAAEKGGSGAGQHRSLTGVTLYLVETNGRIFLTGIDSSWSNDDQVLSAIRGEDGWNESKDRGVPETIALLFACYRLYGADQKNTSQFKFFEPEKLKIGTFLGQRNSSEDRWDKKVFGDQGLKLFCRRNAGKRTISLKDLPPPSKINFELKNKPLTDDELISKLNALITGLFGEKDGKSYFESYANRQSASGKKIPEKVSQADDPVTRYCENWRTIYAAAFHGQGSAAMKPQEPEQSELKARFRHVQKLRLEKYIWPKLAWRRGLPLMYRPVRDGRNLSESQTEDFDGQDLDDSWNDVPGEGASAAWTILKRLRSDRLLVLYDNAGMGKTALTHRLFAMLLDAHLPANANSWHAREPENPLLIVRLEGIWPRDDEDNPLGVVDLLVDEVLGVRVEGQPTPSASADPDSLSQHETDRKTVQKHVERLLSEDRVYFFLDAFDQMTEQDRKAAVVAIHAARTAHGPLCRCHWLVTGRGYALKPHAGKGQLFDRSIYRVRLHPLSPEQQDNYFADLEKHRFFQAQPVGQRKPLDYICTDRVAITQDLGVPLHLFEIRTLIEHSLGDDDSNYDCDPIQQISNSSHLHWLVSEVLLRRSLELASSQSSSGFSADNQVIHLRHICGIIAWQMMLDENYNASMHPDVDLPEYRDIKKPSRVETFLKRCENRYLATTTSGDTDGKKLWQWAITLLEKDLVADRSELDVFKPSCRAFRNRKAMEWYAAHYLMNHVTEKELVEPIDNAGSTCGQDFVGDPSWDRCWRLALEMPIDAVDVAFVSRSLGLLFRRPRREYCRPTRLMFDAWERWLEPQDEDRRPLPEAGKLIACFRDQFTMIYEGRETDEGRDNIVSQQVAQRLRFDENRDRPDPSLPEPNKTPYGWYRRIPPDGQVTRFRGERPAEVTVTAFWLRKFVVTNSEYRLFDPHHRVSWGHDFNEPDQLVVDVNWYAAVMFCRWLGPAYRLPTESEWEAACRANDGSHPETEYWFGDGGERMSDHGWIAQNADDRPHSLRETIVKGGHENPWGLYDMHGNVWEWCQDWNGADPSGETADPQGHSTGSYRVRRGGCWGSTAWYARSALRRRSVPSSRDGSLGFRLALSPLGQEAERPVQ